jgi:chemotaxis protein methyltransferase CheR
MNKDLQNTIDYLATQRDINFAGYNPKMLARIIRDRTRAVKCDKPGEYLDYIKKTEAELQGLLDELTINVSKFFRNPLLFELVAEKILLPMILEKTRKNAAIRIWSAGCAQGEEAYSLAIIIKEFLLKTQSKIKVHIFATDIDKEAIKLARAGKYSFDSIENIRAGLLQTYFKKTNDLYSLRPVIREMVNFSEHDLLDKKTTVPPASIFGNFDLVFCCNVLIYYKNGLQKSILQKLGDSVAPKGVLVLGKAESGPSSLAKNFIPLHEGCVFQKSESARKKNGI